mmetsp:Transcript_13251/g.20999  ORF Transcript_13251/g.20999 Transcript_13251/m.20999 type:complete len:87 (+) Transcript_13251:169-429(+)
MEHYCSGPRKAQQAWLASHDDNSWQACHDDKSSQHLRLTSHTPPVVTSSNAGKVFSCVLVYVYVCVVAYVCMCVWHEWPILDDALE